MRMWAGAGSEGARLGSREGEILRDGTRSHRRRKDSEPAGFEDALETGLGRGLDIRVGPGFPRGGALERKCAFQDGVGSQPPGAGTHLLQPHAKATENLLHVAPFLHGDDSEVVLLVHPHQEALVVIVPRVGRSQRPRNQPLGNPIPRPRRHMPTARGQRAEGH